MQVMRIFRLIDRLDCNALLMGWRRRQFVALPLVASREVDVYRP